MPHFEQLNLASRLSVGLDTLPFLILSLGQVLKRNTEGIIKKGYSIKYSAGGTEIIWDLQPEPNLNLY